MTGQEKKIEIETDFEFLGARRYIHGTTLLAAFAEGLEQVEPAPCRVKRIKFQREAHHNGRIVLAPAGGLDGKILEAAPCYLSCVINGQAWQGCFIEGTLPVSRRSETIYSIENLRGDGKYGGSCHIAARNRAEAIRVIVEANKRMHLTSMPATGIQEVRMGYLEDWLLPEPDAAIEAELTIRNLIAQHDGQRLRTINRLVYSDRAGSRSLVVGFDVKSGGTLV
jgi:hypothetical protein